MGWRRAATWSLFACLTSFFLAVVAPPSGAGETALRVISADPALAIRPVPPVPRTDLLIPGGEITHSAGRVRAAHLTRPTRRYRHAILGDDIEAGGFRIVRWDASEAEFVLPTDSVFEDLRVRLADIDGDGAPEALVVRSYLDRGASLAVFRIGVVRVTLLAETKPIGLPHRWLNPVGVADFDGDGRVEIALVTTPHIGGTLKLYRLQGQELVEVAARYGYSNHRIGSRVLDLATIVDFDGDGIPDIAAPDTARQRLVVVTFAGGRFRVLGRTPEGPEIVTAPRLIDANGDGRTDLVYGLADGRAVAVPRPAP